MLTSSSSPNAQTALDNAAALFDTVRDYQAETERGAHAPRARGQLDEAGLHRMLLPTSLGGLQLDIPTCSASSSWWPKPMGRSAGT